MENDFKNEGRAKALIPARLGSMRLPNKALLDIQGLPMIIDVYRRLFYSRLLSNVFVVTDSAGIQEVVLWHGEECIYKRNKNESGTNRIAEDAAEIDSDIIAKIQGDEALVNPSCVDKAIRALREDITIMVGLLMNSFTS